MQRLHGEAADGAAVVFAAEGAVASGACRLVRIRRRRTGDDDFGERHGRPKGPPRLRSHRPERIRGHVRRAHLRRRGTPRRRGRLWRARLRVGPVAGCYRPAVLEAGAGAEAVTYAIRAPRALRAVQPWREAWPDSVRPRSWT